MIFLLQTYNLPFTVRTDRSSEEDTKGYLGFSSIFYAVVFDVLVMGLENKSMKIQTSTKNHRL